MVATDPAVEQLAASRKLERVDKSKFCKVMCRQGHGGVLLLVLSVPAL